MLPPALMRAGWLGLLGLVLVTACGGRTSDRTTPQPTTTPPPEAVDCSGSTYCRASRAGASDKLDLLLVVDNAPSMGDAQPLLAQALPQLMQRFIDPVCVDDAGTPGKTPGDPFAPCFGGLHRKFRPFRDVHIGIVTSSLGGHGGTACNPTAPEQDDAAHLLGKVRQGLSSYSDLGFLAWDPAALESPLGSQDPQQAFADFTHMVRASGEAGCRLPAPLEAWYRFLVDPAPPANITKDGSSDATVTSGVDQELLAERAAFLRPDSMVVIVMVSDQDDCSVADAGQGWRVGTDQPMPRPTAACAADPTSQCCHSCSEPDPPGCSHDPACDGPGLSATEDSPALRCWDERRRFGFYTTKGPDPSAHFHPEAGLLYPTQRYSNALENAVICPGQLDLECDPGQSGEPNPLYAPSTDGFQRSPDVVLLAGIVGVPWQDIATPDTLHEPDKLDYPTTSWLAQEGRWKTIVGDPAKFTPPADPLMVETPDVRTGQNPVTSDDLAPPSAPPGANPINGHERSIPNRDDLQYACIFPLATPRSCTTGTGCDCLPGKSLDNPLCQNPTTGAYGAVQYFGKAYPGLRQLEVLRELGNNAIVGSLCAKIRDAVEPDFGFNPVASAIAAARFSRRVDIDCLPKPLAVDPTTGHVDCSVVEAIRGAATDGLGCKRPGRFALGSDTAGAQLRKTVLAYLAAHQMCNAQNQPACSSLLLCGIGQFDASTDPAAMAACRGTSGPASDATGFCYAGDAASGEQVGAPALLRECPASQQQVLRFIGNGPVAPLPAASATYFFECPGGA